jgi:hypothetical protein
MYEPPPHYNPGEPQSSLYEIRCLVIIVGALLLGVCLLSCVVVRLGL